MPNQNSTWDTRVKQQESKYLGKKFNHFIVIALYGLEGNRWVFTARCICGSFKYLTIKGLRATLSCGCKRGKHRRTFTRAYKAWQSMEQRCYNPHNVSYQDYAPRGITVCARWLESFENFYEDMGDPPPKYSLGRIDNDGNYCPENCRWEDSVTQNRNTRRTPMLTYNGITKPLAAWAEEAHINVNVLRYRVGKGWDIHDAFFRPIKGHHAA